MRIITTPFRFIGRLFSGFGRWLKNVGARFIAFFTEVPEEVPLADTLSKTVSDPSGLLFHLDAFRKHLLRAVLAFFVATAVAVAYNNTILEFLTRPIGGLEDVIAIDVTEPLSTVMKTSS